MDIVVCGVKVHKVVADPATAEVHSEEHVWFQKYDTLSFPTEFHLPQWGKKKKKKKDLVSDKNNNTFCDTGIFQNMGNPNFSHL